jgi:hypothetical protein
VLLAAGLPLAEFLGRLALVAAQFGDPCSSPAPTGVPEVAPGGAPRSTPGRAKHESGLGKRYGVREGLPTEAGSTCPKSPFLNRKSVIVACFPPISTSIGILVRFI